MSFKHVSNPLINQIYLMHYQMTVQHGQVHYRCSVMMKYLVARVLFNLFVFAALLSLRQRVG